VALLLWAAAAAWPDSVQTKAGDRLRGRVVREDDQTLVFRTAYGELTIPRTEIKKHERATYLVKLTDGSELEGQPTAEADGKLVLKIGEERREVPLASVASIAEKKTPPPPKKLNLRERIQLHRRVLDHFAKKQYDAALAQCKRILESEPDDNTALYNAACACARMGDKPTALDYLRQAVEKGFVDFPHIERDPDLETLRDAEPFRELFARKDHYIQQATRLAIERITKSLAERGVDAKRYKTVVDSARNFVYVHAKDEAELAELRGGLEHYADLQWQDLFQNKPQRPLYIVVLTTEDSRKVFRGRVLGWYNAGASALFCADAPVQKLLRTDVVIHEFTHALHYADMAARQQQHPIWLVEGLATLFEASDRNDEVAPRHSYRLLVVQQALRQGRLMAWKELMGLNQVQFLRSAQLAYAQARYMLFYMHERGLLKKFYDEYTAKENYAQDRTALASFEVVFGKPIEVVEHDWKQWVLAQKVPPVPFVGVQTREKEGRLEVVQVVGGSAAAKAGVRAGDVLVSLGGRAIDSQSDLMEAVGNRKVGERVDLTVLREGKEQALTVTLGERRDLFPRTPKPRAAPYLGLTVEQRGEEVVIREVAKGSPAEAAGLQAGAAILELDGKKLASVRDYLAALRAAKVGKQVALQVRQGQEVRTVSVTPTEAPK
jgi:RNase P/RNase MRP subunit p29